MNLQLTRIALISLLAALTIAWSSASATEAGSVLDRFFLAYERSDVAGMLDLYAEDAVFVDVAQRHHVSGREQLRAFLDRLVSLHLSMGVNEHRRMADGGTIVVEYEYTGELSGDALQAALGTDQCRDTRYRIPVTSWFEVRDGLITRQVDYLDLATLEEVKQTAHGLVQP